MRTTFLLLVLFVGAILASPTKPIEDFSNDSAYSLTVLQINARWNKKTQSILINFRAVI